MKHKWVRIMPKKFRPLKCRTCQYDFHDGCCGAWCICAGCSLEQQRAKTIKGFSGTLFGQAKRPAFNGRVEPYEAEADE